MKLSSDLSWHNYYAFIWHTSFLALAMNFMDVDTVIPAMLIEAGGNGLHIGLMTAIMFGGSSFTQLIFAPFISNYAYKKKFLLLGINARIVSLFFMSIMLYFSSALHGSYTIWLIFLLITSFSLGGAFANVSYTDILGKSVDQSARKSFFSVKQFVTGLVLFLSAFLAKKVITLESFPLNYAYMFLIGFLALLVASLGFWQLKEHVPSKMVIKNLNHFMFKIKTELTQNKRLVYFLGFINTMGISITLLPFVMLYAKELFHTQSHDTGLFLFYKVIGSVTIGLFLFTIFKKFKYSYLLYGNVLLVISVSLILLLTSGMPPFKYIFLTGGIIYSIYGISMNGVLLEVSGNENRVLYTGIAGAGNILPALFPIIGGWIVERFGFQWFFNLFTVMILISLFFIYKLDCRK
jgi:MFS family permease